MKKGIVPVLFLAGTLIFSACGPSAEEIERARQDSIHRADSVAAVIAAEEARQKAIQDSIAAAEQARLAREQFVADSIAAAEEAAKKKGGKPKAKKEEPKKDESAVSKGGQSTSTGGDAKKEEKPKVTKGGK